eukprot:scaffold137430_cov61-Attheya_sp.AAC.2
MIVELPVQKLEILITRKTETVRYFGGQGTAELFKELVDSKSGEDPFNMSLLCHPGAGSLWFVPEDKNQPFLDFFTLTPPAKGTVT